MVNKLFINSQPNIYLLFIFMKQPSWKLSADREVIANKVRYEIAIMTENQGYPYPFTQHKNPKYSCKPNTTPRCQTSTKKQSNTKINSSKTNYTNTTSFKQHKNTQPPRKPKNTTNTPQPSIKNPSSSRSGNPGTRKCQTHLHTNVYKKFFSKILKNLSSTTLQPQRSPEIVVTPSLLPL